jgi:site-specific recombinase XerD
MNNQAKTSSFSKSPLRGDLEGLLEQCSEYLTIKGYTPKTTKTIINTSTQFITWMVEQNIALPQVSYNDIVAYVNYRKQAGNKQRTLQCAVWALNLFFNYLVAEHQYNENPASNVLIKGIKRKTLYEILSPEELDTIYKTFNTEIVHEANKKVPPQTKNKLARKRNKIILSLMVYQGLRTEEIGKLQVQDLQLREGKINIIGAERTEGRLLKLEAHQIYDLSEYVHDIRKQILSVTNKESTLVFISIGTSLNFPNTMIKLMQTITKTNPKVKTAKHIRTSVITNWLKVHNLRKVQYMAGHRYISSTETYQVNNIDELKEDVNKYHPLG